MFFFVFHTFACSPIRRKLHTPRTLCYIFHVVAAPHGFACVGIPATWLYIPSFIEISSGVSGPQGPFWPPGPGGSKFGLSHYFGYSLLQQLVLPYKPWLVYSTSPDSASTVIASDKSSVSTNRKSTTRFPTSHRRSMYVTPKSPKGWLKTRIFTFFALPSHLRCR